MSAGEGWRAPREYLNGFGRLVELNATSKFVSNVDKRLVGPRFPKSAKIMLANARCSSNFVRLMSVAISNGSEVGCDVRFENFREIVGSRGDEYSGCGRFRAAVLIAPLAAYHRCGHGGRRSLSYTD